MTNGHISMEEQPDPKQERRERDAAGVPNNAEQKLQGNRRGAGADTPSGPNTDRSGERAKEEIKEGIEKTGKNPSTEPRV